jgi:Zn-dependent protease with chaperone function
MAAWNGVAGAGRTVYLSKRREVAQAAMDFFACQALARRRTVLLLGLYALSVALVTLVTYAVVSAVTVPLAAVRVFFRDWYDISNTYSPPPLPPFWSLPRFLVVVAVTVAAMLAATVRGALQLSRGGSFVAEWLGGRPVDPTSDSPSDRRLLHVVEEIAIASGTPVPRVFVLEGEPGINAFAAGLTPRDAALAVTSGAVALLTREEMQGVVAHEFSHILNGDMRLKTRVLGVLRGVCLVESVCSWPFRAVSRSLSQGSVAAGGALVLFVATAPVFLPFLLVGWTGSLLARAIRGSLSRQREILADAAAVQFTRDPLGLAGALKKVGGAAVGSRVLHANADETSHFFLADALGKALIEWPFLACHPPLSQRIRFLDPSFTGAYEFVLSSAPEKTAAPPSRAPLPAGPPDDSRAAGPLGDIGAPRPEHLAYAIALLASIPPPLVEAVRTLAGAEAAVYALLLTPDVEVRAEQFDHLRRAMEPAAFRAMEALLPSLGSLSENARLPLAELAVSTLRGMDHASYTRFRDDVETLATADERIDLFEYVLYRMMLRRLAPAFEPSNAAPVRHSTVAAILPACRDLLSCLARWGADGEIAAAAAVRDAADRLGAGDVPTLLPKEECTVALLDRALSVLSESSMPLRQRVLDACLACIVADGAVRPQEGMFLQAVADALDCPMPPLLPGQPLGLGQTRAPGETAVRPAC